MQNAPHNTFLLGSRSYDLIKKLVQVIIPAFSAAYFSLAGIWDLPDPEKVVGTLAIVTTFLGVCLGLSTAQYNASGKAFDGVLSVTKSPEGVPQVTGLHYNGVNKDLEGKKAITLKVEEIAPIAQEAVTENDRPPMNPATRNGPPLP